MTPWRFMAVTLMACWAVSLVEWTMPQVAIASEGASIGCGSWTYGGCGQEGCAAKNKPKFRFCNGVKVYASPKCVYFESCCNYTWVWLGCGAANCPTTHKRQRGTSTVAGCSTPTYRSCQASSACGYVSTPAPPAPPAPQKYGFAVPDHAPYNFNLSSNSTKNLLGLAAKGNIVIGDYTDSPVAWMVDFSDVVVPKLKPQTAVNPNGVTKPYVVDPTDADLGYDSADPSLCGGISPCFNGNYTVQDKQGGLPAFKLDGVTPRKFYETSLSDASFKALVNPNMNNVDYTTPITVDAVLFTNHAIASLVQAQNLVINGAVVARDDATVFNQSLTINHDIRLLNDPSTKSIVLPLSLGRPVLQGLKECSPTSCD